MKYHVLERIDFKIYLKGLAQKTKKSRYLKWKKNMFVLGIKIAGLFILIAHFFFIKYNRNNKSSNYSPPPKKQIRFKN